MIHFFDTFRYADIASVTFKLFLALLMGGFIGLNRELRGRAAGFRTYMLVCIGAALTFILGQYEYLRLHSVWETQQAALGLNIDVSRYGAQVINGIGFLGAGTILVTDRQETKGLTTAAGLWASGCLGLAIGAGFFEAAIMEFLLILFSYAFLNKVEQAFLAKSRNINIYVEFNSVEGFRRMVRWLKRKTL